MADFLEKWAEQSEENARLVAQETLITEVTEAIWGIMEEAGIKKVDLARKLGATKGYITQVLNGSRNMTLRTLSDICFALDYKPSLCLEPKQAAGKWKPSSQKPFSFEPARLKYIQIKGNVIKPANGWKSAA